MSEIRENPSSLIVLFLLYANLAIWLSILIAFVAVILTSPCIPGRKTPAQQRGLRLSEFPSRVINSALMESGI